MNKIEVIRSSFNRAIAKLLAPKNKSQFRLPDDLDSDNWNGYKMLSKAVTIYDDKLHFRETGVFTLKGDNLSMITDYDFNKTDSIDTKQFNNFLDEKHFDIHAKCKCSTEKNLIINYPNKIAILASGLKTIFL